MPKIRTRNTVQTPEPVFPAPARPEPIRPGGKLGLVVRSLASEQGVTLDELTAATGWQSHTVRAALSRLKGRGFPARLEVEGERKVYRLSRPEA
jgi:hypothetical protein